LPDVRHTFFTKEGEGRVNVVIVRHWFVHEDYDEPDFQVAFDINYIVNGITQQRTSLPVGTDESKAINIAHELYEEDVDYTREWWEAEEMERAERRMGA